MTQDVQPLTWQKRTNIEEHQQFFSKINEIIGNLAPTVDEAEQAIAQATQAVTDANAAITTANAASAAADAAAQQAQTAANTVAGYNTRLIAVEDEAAGNTANITDLQDRMGTAEGKITALQGVQGEYVKKAGAAQTVTSQIMVPTTATGLRDTQIANGTRIQNDLAAYEPMVRNTGNVSIYGRKAINVASIRNLNGEGTVTSCLELYRFRPTSGQDHRFNFFCQLGMGVCHVFLRIQIPVTSVEIIDGTKTPIGNSSGNITIGAGINADGWCVVYEKESVSCIFCNLLSAFTGSRFPIKEANVDMSKQCNTVELTDLSGIKEVTL